MLGVDRAHGPDKTHAAGAARADFVGEAHRSARGTEAAVCLSGAAGNLGSCALSGYANRRQALHHRSLALVVWLITKANAKRFENRHEERVGQPGYPQRGGPVALRPAVACSLPVCFDV